MVEMPAGLQHPVDLSVHLLHAQVPRRPLKGDDVEMVVGKGQLVDIADHTADVKPLCLRALPPDPLHVDAAVDRMHLERRLALEQPDPHGIGAGANIEHSLPGSQLHGADEACQEPAPQPEARDMVRAIVVGGDVSEDPVQVLGPDRLEALFARSFARGDRRGIHL
jgi:hypothetical protein